jgi:hypothetical protein
MPVLAFCSFSPELMPALTRGCWLSRDVLVEPSRWLWGQRVSFYFPWRQAVGEGDRWSISPTLVALAIIQLLKTAALLAASRLAEGKSPDCACAGNRSNAAPAHA